MLQGKNAVITGSTSGIGLGIAKSLASVGCNITLNGFGDNNIIESLKISIMEEFKVKCIYSNADMTNPEQIKHMIDDTATAHGSVDILVNNAGIQFVSAIDNFPEQKWDDIIAINLSSSFHSIKHALPLMRTKGWGRIVNIASAHGLVASINKSAYVAAKHGVVGLTKVVGLETAEENITCNVICPGWVLTPLVEKQIIDKAQMKKISIDEATKELLSEKQPSLKFVKESDIGQAVLFFCSEAASQITGTSLSIDGGWTAR